MEKKLYLVSLGCPKNLVDSEVMLGSLEAAGYNICQDPEDAGVILVNTCGFIQSAVEEAIETILELAKVKESRPDLLLVVTGCMVQRYGDDLHKELPEVDLFVGSDGFFDITQRIGNFLSRKNHATAISEKPEYLMNSDTPRRISTPAHRAYLKISEGCSNRCSYCLIPSLRGKLRSRPQEDLLKEAKSIKALGVKELTLVGQDLTAYGVDFGSGPQLHELLQSLLSVNIPWLRTLYLYPNRVTQGLVDLMANNPSLLPYFDIPLQHVSDHVLHLMKRPYQHENIEKLLAMIRNKLPHAAIRTTFIVGFPGETDNDVEELLQFIKTFRLNHVGIFAYSNEEGSASSALPDHIPEGIKEERRNLVMETQAEVSTAIHQEMIGDVFDVLVEGISEETDLLLEGRTKGQAPEIDGKVYINSGECEIGDIVQVKITDAHTYDLIGEIV